MWRYMTPPYHYPLHGTCPVITGASFRKYAAKMLAITMMAVIGLWICQGTERQRTQQPDTSIQQVLFMDGEEGVGGDSSPERQERRPRREEESMPWNHRVVDGGWGAAISHVAAGVEWAPDPPEAGEVKSHLRV